MSIKTYVAVLHDSATLTSAGEPVLCALQPDGTPKLTIDHGGVLYQLVTETTRGVYDYERDPNPASPSD